MKTCSTCKLEKSIDSFGKDRSRRDGLRTYCKSCAKIHRQNSAPKIKIWKDANRESINQYLRNYYRDNKESRLQIEKAFRQENPELMRERRRANYEANKAAILARNREYQLKNPDKIKAIKTAWGNAKLKSCPLHALKRRYRSRVRMALIKGGFQRESTTAQLLGCSWECMRDHLESRFLNGMGWHNMRLWHIDHITPLSSAKDSEEVARLCHYTNLQPLWAKDNLSKGSRMPVDIMIMVGDSLMALDLA